MRSLIRTLRAGNPDIKTPAATCAAAGAPWGLQLERGKPKEPKPGTFAVCLKFERPANRRQLVRAEKAIQEIKSSYCSTAASLAGLPPSIAVNRLRRSGAVTAGSIGY